MERRRLLASVGPTTAALAGCLSSSSDGDDEPAETDSTTPENVPEDDSRYVECSNRYVLSRHLPDEVAAEVNLALEDGSYTADGTLYYERAIRDDAVLWVDDEEAFYEHSIAAENGSRTLTLERTEPTLPDPTTLIVTNRRDTDATVRVTVTNEYRTTTYLDESVTVASEPDGGSPSGEYSVSDEFGTFRVHVRPDDGRPHSEIEDERVSEYVVVRPVHAAGSYDRTIRVDLGTTVSIDFPINVTSKAGHGCRGRGGWWGGPYP